MMPLWIAVLLGAVAVSVASDDCPARKDIFPCFCEDDLHYTSIDCAYVKSIETLRPVLEKTRGGNFSFAFWDTRFGEIPSDFFQGHHSTNLHFEHCEIDSFGSKPFTGLENSLKSLYIYSSIDKRVKDLETFPLGHLESLEDVAFQENRITRLGNDWFSGGPAGLSQLNLEGNRIKELGDRAFAELENVEQIWLGDNSFKKVSRSQFPKPANKLWLLDLSFVGLKELPEDIFDDMPVLREVNVAGNKLKSIPEATWGRIWGQLEEVYLETNAEFVCDENIKWIYHQGLPRILTGRCEAGIEKLLEKDLEDLKIEDFEQATL